MGVRSLSVELPSRAASLSECLESCGVKVGLEAGPGDLERRGLGERLGVLILGVKVSSRSCWLCSSLLFSSYIFWYLSILSVISPSRWTFIATVEALVLFFDPPWPETD